MPSPFRDMKLTLPSTLFTHVVHLSPKITAVIIGAFILYLSSHYILYAYHAWFFQDDFGLLIGYRNALNLEQILTFENWGRTVSRNIYWHFGERIFSGNASHYFLLNFSLLLLASIFIFKVFLPELGRSYSLLLTALFLALPPVWIAYSWIANSQHIIAYVLVFVFAHYFFQNLKSEECGLQYWILFPLYLVALASNIFAGLIVVLPFLGLWLIKNEGLRRANAVLAVFCCASLFYFAARLSEHSIGPYTSHFSLDVVHRNARYYFGNELVFWVWLIVNFGGLFYSLKMRLLVCAWCFSSSVLFFTPFMILVEQRFLQYAALTYFFSVAGPITLTVSYLRNRCIREGKVFQVFLVVLFFSLVEWQTMPLVKRYLTWPMGYRQIEIVEGMQTINQEKGSLANRYCFGRADGALAINDSPTSSEWLALGYGFAFTLFVDNTKQYLLSAETDDCDATIWIEEGTVFVVN